MDSANLEILHRLTALQRQTPNIDASSDLREAALKFESVFLKMMLQSMRQANLGEGFLQSANIKFYQQWYDQVLSEKLASQSILGIADMLVKQLSASTREPAQSEQGHAPRQTQVKIDAITGHAFPAQMSAALINRDTRKEQHVARSLSALPDASIKTYQIEQHDFDDQANFIDTLMPLAQKAASVLGLSPVALLAQAALETAWGKAIPKQAKELSFNLFGIKSGQAWLGRTIELPTSEVVNGQVIRVKAGFRAYGSFAESFDDYVQLLHQHPRYQLALASAGDIEDFFQLLQKAGYASDPYYSDKILKIIKNPLMQAAQARLKEPSG